MGHADQGRPYELYHNKTADRLRFWGRNNGQFIKQYWFTITWPHSPYMKYKILHIRTGTSTSNLEPEIVPLSFKYLRNKISVKRLFAHSILTTHPGSWVEECRYSVCQAWKRLRIFNLCSFSCARKSKRTLCGRSGLDLSCRLALEYVDDVFHFRLQLDVAASSYCTDAIVECQFVTWRYLGEL